MASIIDTPIPVGAIELIRNRIAQILTDELPNQATLLGDPNINAKVFVERFISFSETETPCVNVSLSVADYGAETALTQPGTYRFAIDIYEKSKSEGNVRGDFLASNRLQILVNVCRGILSHHRYKTLAFQAPFIGSRIIKDINIANPQKDEESANFTWARMIFEVKAPELVDGEIPPNIAGFVTQQVVGGTDDGYVYGGDAPQPPVEPICADVTMDFNGTGISNTQSGGNKIIIVETDAAIPLQTGIKLIDTPNELRIQVADVAPLSRIYMRPIPTGQLETKRAFDDGDRVTTSADPSTQPAQGKPVRLNLKKKWLLIDVNTHGHLFRFVGSNGGYWDVDLADYKDVNGVTTTRALAFPNNYLEDHRTGLGWIMVVSATNLGWNDTMDEIAILVAAGFSDWFLPNSNELISIVNKSYIQPFGTASFPTGNTPFDVVGNVNKWTATTIKSLPTRREVVTSIGLCNTQDISVTARYLPCRYALNNTA